MSEDKGGRARSLSLWIGLSALIVMLLIGAVALLELQRARMFEDYQEQARDDLELLRFFVHDALQQQDYQRIDDLIKVWGERRAAVATIRLTAANGFVLGEFKRPVSAYDSLYLHDEIPYSYEGVATLELVKDRKRIHQGLKRLGLELVLGVVLVTLVLWRLVQLSVRERQKTAILRKQKAQLDTANERLRQGARALHGMRSYLKNILDSMPSLLVGVDQDGRIIQWNRGAVKSTQMSAEQAIGQPFEQMLPWLASLSDKLQQAIHSGQPVHADRLTTRDGDEMRYSEVMIYPLVTGDARGAVVRVDDITSRIRMEQMMVQTEKMITIGGLAAGMAHEINNPLSGVLQSCQNISRRISLDLPANQEAAAEAGIDLERMQRYLQQRGVLEFLNGIRDAAQRAGRIVADMLAFSRRSSAEFSPVQADAMLDEVVRLASSDYDLKKHYDFRQLQIVREYDPDLGPLLCDRTEIEQVLFNLIKNAAQAMYESDRHDVSRIVLRTVREPDYGRIEVEDNGPGMDEETLQRVFEPFFTTKPTGEGTGLGLSVSYFIITEQHRGHFSVYSRLGEGSRFVIRLPVHEEDHFDATRVDR